MGHVNVPDGLKEIIQQNNEKAYPQIIMEQASYPYLFHLSDIRENLIAFLPVTKQMHGFRAECRMRCTDRKTAFYGVTCDGSGGE